MLQPPVLRKVGKLAQWGDFAPKKFLTHDVVRGGLPKQELMSAVPDRGAEREADVALRTHRWGFLHPRRGVRRRRLERGLREVGRRMWRGDGLGRGRGRGTGASIRKAIGRGGAQIRGLLRRNHARIESDRHDLGAQE